MIFKIPQRKSYRMTENYLKNWHPYFAWWPTVISQNEETRTIAWLQTIQRYFRIVKIVRDWRDRPVGVRGTDPQYRKFYCPQPLQPTEPWSRR